MSKFYHPLHKEYYCNEYGEIFSEKIFKEPRGIQYTLNKLMFKNGFWKPKIQFDKDGYRKCTINGNEYRCNRFCYECYHNILLEYTTKFVVDHINHIVYDDSLLNLRYISQKENIDNEHRNNIVSKKIRANRHGKNGDGSLEEYLSTPHTLSHFKRDIEKRGLDWKSFNKEFFSKDGKNPIKYIFYKKEM